MTGQAVLAHRHYSTQKSGEAVSLQHRSVRVAPKVLVPDTAVKRAKTGTGGAQGAATRGHVEAGGLGGESCPEADPATRSAGTNGLRATSPGSSTPVGICKGHPWEQL